MRSAVRLTACGRVCSFGPWPPAGGGRLESKAAVPFLDSACAGGCEACRRREVPLKTRLMNTLGLGEQGL